jgi:hypothetical protein
MVDGCGTPPVGSRVACRPNSSATKPSTINLRRPTRRSAEDGAVLDRYRSTLLRLERTTDVVISKALEPGSATRFEKSPLCSSIETANGRSGDWLQYILSPNRGVDVREPIARLRQRQRRGLNWSASGALRSRMRNGPPQSTVSWRWRSSFAGGSKRHDRQFSMWLRCGKVDERCPPRYT